MVFSVALHRKTIELITLNREIMLKNNIEQFIESIFQLLTGKPEIRGLLVKKHSENFRSHGEFSFTNSLKSWHGCINADPDSLNEDNTLLQYLKKNEQNIVEESKSWTFRVKQTKITNDRVYLFVERISAIITGLREGLHNNLIISKNERRPCYVIIDPECEKSNNITSLRVKYLAKVVENLSTLTNECDKLPEVVVSSKSCKNDGRTVTCGAVLNAKTNLKESNINADEFIRLRQTEMTLIAQHKYGARVTSDTKWNDFLAQLGESAVAFELLQCKPSSALKVNFDNVAAGSSKGASFILYNCARLETIIKTYNDKVLEGVYPPLPEFEETDFSLLTEEDEWHLIFNYILSFPSMLAQCVEINERCCEFRPHYICQFLNGMVRVISQYYRKTRILLLFGSYDHRLLLKVDADLYAPHAPKSPQSSFVWAQRRVGDVISIGLREFRLCGDFGAYRNRGSICYHKYMPECTCL